MSEIMKSHPFYIFASGVVLSAVATWALITTNPRIFYLEKKADCSIADAKAENRHDYIDRSNVSEGIDKDKRSDSARQIGDSIFSNFDFASGNPAAGSINLDNTEVKLITTNTSKFNTSVRSVGNQAARVKLEFSDRISNFQISIQNPAHIEEHIFDFNLGLPEKLVGNGIKVNDNGMIVFPPYSSGTLIWSKIDAKIVKLSTASQGGYVQFNSFEFLLL